MDLLDGALQRESDRLDDDDLSRRNDSRASFANICSHAARTAS
jgi:hypothetical protein